MHELASEKEIDHRFARNEMTGDVPVRVAREYERRGAGRFEGRKELKNRKVDLIGNGIEEPEELHLIGFIGPVFGRFPVLRTFAGVPMKVARHDDKDELRPAPADLACEFPDVAERLAEEGQRFILRMLEDEVAVGFSHASHEKR